MTVAQPMLRPVEAMVSVVSRHPNRAVSLQGGSYQNGRYFPQRNAAPEQPQEGEALSIGTKAMPKQIYDMDQGYMTRLPPGHLARRDVMAKASVDSGRGFTQSIARKGYMSPGKTHNGTVQGFSNIRDASPSTMEKIPGYKSYQGKT